MSSSSRTERTTSCSVPTMLTLPWKGSRKPSKRPRSASCGSCPRCLFCPGYWQQTWMPLSRFHLPTWTKHRPSRRSTLTASRVTMRSKVPSLHCCRAHRPSRRSCFIFSNRCPWRCSLPRITARERRPMATEGDWISAASVKATCRSLGHGAWGGMPATMRMWKFLAYCAVAVPISLCFCRTCQSPVAPMTSSWACVTATSRPTWIQCDQSADSQSHAPGVTSVVVSPSTIDWQTLWL
mmetsp:Transcript_52196/g.167270  ORF Transcript_52196/g.167270 Transcript_52196/m.167270 type:complete len:238 (-) Transcript_52196:1860-2573(-)